MNSQTHNLFTFVWKIENWQMKRYHEITSPKFSVENFLNTAWYLDFYECSNNYEQRFKFECSLGRHKCSDGPDEIKICFNIVLSYNSDEPTNFENGQIGVFQKGSLKMYNNLSWERHQTWLRSSEFIYVICHMSLDADETEKHVSNVGSAFITNYLNFPLTSLKHLKLEPSQEYKYLQELQNNFFRFSNKCFARTVISMEKKTFIWSIEDIFNSVTKKHATSMAKFSDFLDLLVKLHINEENTIKMEFLILNKSLNDTCFCIHTVWLSDSDGNTCCSTENFDFHDSKQWQLNTELETKNVFLEKPQFEIKTSRLNLEIRISNGDTFSYIESTSPANFLNLNASHNNHDKSNLRITMENMYNSKIFCDVTLQLPCKKFEAHKSVLCNNSPVFRAMFESKMQENKTNTVVIVDTDEDTVNSILKFMYSDILEDMRFEKTLKLYVAADKYQILPLRKKCALRLQSKLTNKNALPLLSLTDAHGDKELKSCVFKFIVRHMNEIMVLEDWKIFSKRNILLANEILENVCMNLFGLKSNIKSQCQIY